MAGNNKKEATETIKAVTASYGYKPERSCLRGQAGAAIASKKNKLLKKRERSICESQILKSLCRGR